MTTCYTTKLTTRRADQVSDMDVLADETIVIKISYQLNWTYLTVANPKNGKVTRRRYRPSQAVQVQEWEVQA